LYKLSKVRLLRTQIISKCFTKEKLVHFMYPPRMPPIKGKLRPNPSPPINTNTKMATATAIGDEVINLTFWRKINNKKVQI
jgi:hypothetical protein